MIRKTEVMKKMKLEDVIRDYQANLFMRNLSPDTQRHYKSVLGQFLDYMRAGQDIEVPMEAVTPEAARGFITYKLNAEVKWADSPIHPPEEGKISINSIRAYIRSLRAFGTWLARQGYDNPFTGLQMPKAAKKLISILSEEEINAIYQTYNPNTHHGARWQAMMALVYQSGLRVSEVAGLRLEDLDLERFRAKVRGKGAKERYIVFGAKAYEPLSRYIHLFRPKSDEPFVFLNEEGRPLSITAAQHIIDHVRRRTGIKRLHWHLLRHTFATNYLIAGGNVFELQALLGHEDIKTTQVYVHLAQTLQRMEAHPDRLQKRMALIDSMPGLGQTPSDHTARRRGAGGQFRPRPAAGQSPA